MFKLDLEKAKEPEIKLPTSVGLSKKQESSRKTSTYALLTTPKPLTVWISTNWKLLKEITDYLTCLLRNLYAGQEATVRTGHGTTNWFQIWKGECQGCILWPCLFSLYAEFSSVHSLSRVWLFETPWTIAHQASLSITNSGSPPKPMSIESVMPSNDLILCHPLLLLPSIFPSIRVFSNESALCIRWPKYWSFSFNFSLSNEHPGLISFRIDWLDIFAVQGTLKSLLQYHSSKWKQYGVSLKNLK